METIIFLLVGALSGFLAGLLGIGGGLITVPAMVFLLPVLDHDFSQIMHIAIATSLAAIIPTAALSAYRHNKHRAIDWRYARQMSPGLVLGSLAGAFLITFVEREPLQAGFAGFLLLVAAYLFLGQPLPERTAMANHTLTRFVSGVIGLVSALLGVGGGTMTVPYLIWQGVNPRIAVGTSAFCGIPIAVSAALLFQFVTLASEHTDGTAFIYWPALYAIIAASMLFTPLGAYFAQITSTRKLKRIFAIMLFIVAIMMLRGV